MTDTVIIGMFVGSMGSMGAGMWLIGRRIVSIRHCRASQ